MNRVAGRMAGRMQTRNLIAYCTPALERDKARHNVVLWLL
jgi:hypothetical protein